MTPIRVKAEQLRAGDRIVSINVTVITAPESVTEMGLKRTKFCVQHENGRIQYKYWNRNTIVTVERK